VASSVLSFAIVKQDYILNFSGLSSWQGLKLWASFVLEARVGSFPIGLVDWAMHLGKQ